MESSSDKEMCYCPLLEETKMTGILRVQFKIETEKALILSLAF